MKLKFITFNDESFNVSFSEKLVNEALKQMKKPVKKRLYINGIEFSQIKKIEFVVGD